MFVVQSLKCSGTAHTCGDLNAALILLHKLACCAGTSPLSENVCLVMGPQTFRWSPISSAASSILDCCHVVSMQLQVDLLAGGMRSQPTA